LFTDAGRSTEIGAISKSSRRLFRVITGPAWLASGPGQSIACVGLGVLRLAPQLRLSEKVRRHRYPFSQSKENTVNSQGGILRVVGGLGTQGT